MISFQQVPANLRIPFLYAEFNNAGAFRGDSLQPGRVIMIGPRLSTGIKQALTKSLVTSPEQGKEFFGAGSLLSEMVAKFLNINKSNELYCIPVDDNSSGIAASGSLDLSGSPTASGTLKVYISEKLVSVAVSSGQSLTAIATSLAAAIQADTSLLVSAVVDSETASKVNLTAKNKGTIGNDIDVRLNYYDGDELPAGLGLSISQMSSGATNPNINEVFAILDDTQHLHWICAYRDPATLAAIESELSTRFGPITQNDGYCHYGARGTLSGLNTIGDAQNSQFTIIHPCWGPTHPASQVSAFLASIALSAMNDPALPLQNIEVPGILPCQDHEKLDLLERNTLLFHGISSNKVVGTKVILERVITTYKKSNAGADDISYLNLERLLTLSYLRYDWRTFWLSKYPRHKLGKDGQQYGDGQPIMTPNTGYAEAVGWFKRKMKQGLVEDLEQFKRELIVEINEQNPDRMDFLLAPNVINQLIVVGTQFKFLV